LQSYPGTFQSPFFPLGGDHLRANSPSEIGCARLCSFWRYYLYATLVGGLPITSARSPGIPPKVWLEIRKITAVRFEAPCFLSFVRFFSPIVDGPLDQGRLFVLSISCPPPRSRPFTSLPSDLQEKAQPCYPPSFSPDCPSQGKLAFPFSQLGPRELRFCAAFIFYSSSLG